MDNVHHFMRADFDIDRPFIFSQDFSLYKYTPQAYLWMASQADT